MPGQALQGITVLGVAEDWSYSPQNLPDYVTPVRVKVINDRADPILVNLSDAFLVDERGFRRQALNPGDAVQFAASARNDRGSGGSGIRPRVSISPSIGFGYFGVQLGRVGLSGSGWPLGKGGLRQDTDLTDPLHVGLRPGRLDPGTSVEGYLFFEKPLRPSDKNQRFRIAWNFRPVTPVGTPLALPFATVEVPLVAR